MKKIIIVLLICILMTGCISIDINIGTNSKEDETYLLKDSKKSYSELEDEAKNLLDKETITEKEESKVKKIFVTLTDFLFNGGTIKGKTFKELTIEAKTKCIDGYNYIKTKLEEKYPNYKEELPAKAKETVSNIGEKLNEVKESLKNEYKEFFGEDEYQDLEEAFNSDKENLMEVYETYKPYIDEAKEKAKSGYSKVKEKASELYNEYKDK